MRYQDAKAALIAAQKGEKALTLEFMLSAFQNNRFSANFKNNLWEQFKEQQEILSTIQAGRYIGNDMYQIECLSFRTHVFKDCTSHAEPHQCFCDECPIAGAGMKGLKKCFGIVTNSDIVRFWEKGKTPEGVILKHGESPVARYIKLKVEPESEVIKVQQFLEEQEKKAFAKYPALRKKTA